MKQVGIAQLLRLQEVRERQARENRATARRRVDDHKTALERAERTLAMQRRLAQNAEEERYSSLLEMPQSRLGFERLDVDVQSILHTCDKAEHRRDKRQDDLTAATADYSACALLHVEAYRRTEVWAQISKRMKNKERRLRLWRQELIEELDAPPPNIEEGIG